MDRPAVAQGVVSPATLVTRAVSESAPGLQV